MTEYKQDEGFKVVDRRLFTEDGELRNDAVERERREEEQAAHKAANAAQAVKSAAIEKEQSPAGGALGAPSGSAIGGLAQPPADATPSSRSFQMLVDFLARNAAAMLGGMADPQTGQPYVDIDGAREVIDMLDVLREKTRGNLAKADEDLLIEVLGSLKLTFMEISKAAAAAIAQRAVKK